MLAATYSQASSKSTLGFEMELPPRLPTRPQRVPPTVLSYFKDVYADTDSP